MQRSGAVSKIVMVVVCHLLVRRSVHCLRFGLSLGGRPPFLLGHHHDDSSHHPDSSPPYHSLPSHTHLHQPSFYPHFHPDMPFYATHQPYPSYGSSSVSPCYSHHFQILANFYGDYFKKGVICSSGGSEIFDVRDEVKQGHNFALRSDIVKSYTDAETPAPFDTRDSGDMCEKVPKVCELFNQKKQRSPRLLPPTGKGVWSNMRDSINNIFSYMTRRSFPSSPSSHFPNPSISEPKLPLFSVLSSAPSQSTGAGADHLPQLAQLQQEWGSQLVNGSHDSEGCHGDGCTFGAAHSTRLSGYHTGDGLPHPTKGVSVCEESEGVAYPLVGVSATTGRPVRLLQHHPILTQPVFFTRCVTPRTQLLSGRCQQKFLPVAFLVDEPNAGSGRYPRYNHRSSKGELNETHAVEGEKNFHDENNYDIPELSKSPLNITASENQGNVNLNVTREALLSHPHNRKLAPFLAEGDENSETSLQNGSDLNTKASAKHMKRVRDFEVNTSKNGKAQESQNNEERDVSTERMLAILESVHGQPNRKLEALLRSRRGQADEKSFKHARNRRSTLSIPRHIETKSPKVEASKRFSFSFFDNIFSGSEHVPSYAPTPLGAHGAPFLDLRRYDQDYVLVEAGCKVIIDLPAVRREAGGVVPSPTDKQDI